MLDARGVGVAGHADRHRPARAHRHHVENVARRVDRRVRGVAGQLHEAGALREARRDGAGVEAAVVAVVEGHEAVARVRRAHAGAAFEDVRVAVLPPLLELAPAHLVRELHEVDDGRLEVGGTSVLSEGHGHALPGVEARARAVHAAAVVVDDGGPRAEEQVRVHVPPLLAGGGDRRRGTAVAGRPVVVAPDVVEAHGAVLQAVVGEVDVVVGERREGGRAPRADDGAEACRTDDVEHVAVGEGVARGRATRGAAVGLADVAVEAEVVAVDALAEHHGVDPPPVGRDAPHRRDGVEVGVPVPTGHVLHGVEAEAVDALHVHHPLHPAQRVPRRALGHRVARAGLGEVEATEGQRRRGFVAPRHVARRRIGPAGEPTDVRHARIAHRVDAQRDIGIEPRVGGVGLVEVRARRKVPRVARRDGVADELVVGRLVDVGERDEVAAEQAVPRAAG